MEVLAGRTAVVTGGSGSIGAAIARGLKAASADVLVAGASLRTLDVARDLGVPGVRADLTESAGREQLAATAFDELGHVDVLVVAHGEAHAVAALEETPDAWRRTLEVNLTATFELCQRFGAPMLERGWGRIILISSMYAFFGGVKVAAYTASKAGVAQLAKALANEWAGHGVNVNAIAPGYVRTSLNEHVWGDPVRSNEIVARTPAGRWGEPEDIVGPVIFLASEAAGFVHGIVLPIDGGFLGR